jgi:hypothetical protein
MGCAFTYQLSLRGSSDTRLHVNFADLLLPNWGRSWMDLGHIMALAVEKDDAVLSKMGRTSRS